jgi:hypothetical protein
MVQPRLTYDWRKCGPGFERTPGRSAFGLIALVGAPGPSHLGTWENIRFSVIYPEHST